MGVCIYIVRAEQAALLEQDHPFLAVLHIDNSCFTIVK